MCEHTLQLVYLFVEVYLKPVAAARETAAFLASCLCFLYWAQWSLSSSIIYLNAVGVLVEAYLKPVAFPATSLCFLIWLSSHPAAALYI